MKPPRRDIGPCGRPHPTKSAAIGWTCDACADLDLSHGLRSTNELHGCRCADCVRANLDRKRAYRDRQRQTTHIPPVWADFDHLKPGAGVRRRGT